MPATLDRRKAHATRQHGDLLVIFTWINDERAMVLVPAYRPGAPWCVVAESATFRHDDPKYVALQCVKACEVLGIKPSKENWARIGGIIVDGLPDLIRMPSAPRPEYRPGSFGSMTLRADGQVLAQQDIRLEREGVAYGGTLRCPSASGPCAGGCVGPLAGRVAAPAGRCPGARALRS